MFLIFDTETTGLPKNWKAPLSDLSNWPRLVQIAWILFDKDANEIESYDAIIKPEDFQIPENASQVHRISTAHALEIGKPIDEVLDIFSITISKSDFLIAHNMSFDEKIVGAEFLRLKQKNNFSKIKKICTKEVSTDFCAIPNNKGYGYKWPTLAELYKKLFNDEIKESHNAITDVQACAKCFFELKDNGIIKIPQEAKL